MSNHILQIIFFGYAIQFFSARELIKWSLSKLMYKQQRLSAKAGKLNRMEPHPYGTRFEERLFRLSPKIEEGKQLGLKDPIIDANLKQEIDSIQDEIVKNLPMKQAKMAKAYLDLEGKIHEEINNMLEVLRSEKMNIEDAANIISMNFDNPENERDFENTHYIDDFLTE